MKVGDVKSMLDRLNPERELLVSVPDGLKGGDYELQTDEHEGRLAVTIFPDGGPVCIYLGRIKPNA